MTLADALQLARQAKQNARERRIFLVCGFEALHLVTFLQGHFARRFPAEQLVLETGLYGGLETSLVRAAESGAEAAVLTLEWADVDPRLGLRGTGGWGPRLEQDIVDHCRESLVRLAAAVELIARRIPVVLSPPSLPLPFFGHTPGWQAGKAEIELERQMAEFLAGIAQQGGVTILRRARLDAASPAAARLDPLLMLRAGFPYSLAHASTLAGMIISCLYPPGPMKGLITDLDDTLWSGIAGEVGPENVSWALSDGAQLHALYQQQLRQFSEMGVLLAVASKNELEVARTALARKDLLAPADAFLPVMANWGPKSAMIAEILQAWNIHADSVVFVDDSPMEIVEVQAAFPEITCLEFPKGRPARAMELFERLRDLFGKPVISADDRIRQASIRARGSFLSEAGQGSSVDFARTLQGRVTLDLRKDPSNTRQLELINKTNQFNLNGIRISPGEWRRLLEREDSFVVAAAYEDRFGPLGTIGVMAGSRDGGGVEISTWVLSCRAFSRRIEHHMLDSVFEQFGAAAVNLHFAPTDRNQPLQEFLRPLAAIGPGSGAQRLIISREQWRECAGGLPHRVLAG